MADKPYLKGIQYRDYVSRLKGFKADLLQRGRKVLASQNRLTREIRTLLLQTSNQSTKALHLAISDIKAWCIADRDWFSEHATDILLEIEHKPMIHLPMERPLWSATTNTVLDFGDILSASSADAPDIQFNERTPPACWQLEERVDSLLTDRASFTLPELIDVYPLEFELEELVGYLSVGMKNPQHNVSHREPLALHDFELPHITFKKTGTSQEKPHV